jgi:hypothetical protein
MAIDVFVGDRVVAIHLTGLDAVWSLRSRLLLPLDEVAGAEVISRDEAMSALGWRLGGTYLPGVAAAGNFSVEHGDGDRAFCCVYRDPEVLRITTRNPRPRMIVLQHPDRHELAWLIGERVQ